MNRLEEQQEEVYLTVEEEEMLVANMSVDTTITLLRLTMADDTVGSGTQPLLSPATLIILASFHTPRFLYSLERLCLPLFYHSLDSRSSSSPSFPSTSP